MTDDERFQEWGDRILTIHEHITEALASRRIHNEVGAILQNNPQLWRDNNSFYAWMASTYEDSILMAVRRQVDKDKRSISLALLLEEIIASPHILSRERFIERVAASHMQGSEDAVRHAFDHFTVPGAKHINANAVRADLHDLRAQTDPIQGYANKRVAHFDAKGPEDSLTVLQVHAALDHLDALREKYVFLLRGENYKEPQLADEETWKDVFREPWIP